MLCLHLCSRACAITCTHMQTHTHTHTHTHTQGWDEVLPNAHAPMPFAWDEPMGAHVVQAVAHASGADMHQVAQQVRSMRLSMA